MSMEVCEGEGGFLWWEWNDQELSSSRSSTAYVMYYSIVPPSQQQFYSARAEYSSLSRREIVLCDGGKVGASVEVNKDHQGTKSGEVKVSVEKTTDNDTTFRVDVQADIRQDKDGNVQTGAGGKFSIEREF